MSGFSHREIDAKWQDHWRDRGTFATRREPGRPKYYVLDMFPYPSGVGLHVGHPKGYVATDVVARARRMMGFNVLHPMGWDSFGLPAERQAVKEGLPPARHHAAQHRDVQAPAGDPRPELRLVARAGHQRSALLQVDAVDLPEAVREGPGLPGRGAGQLVPGARHRAGQRGGQGRQVRRDRRPGRAPHDEAVDAAHHQLRRSPGRGSRPTSTGPRASRRCSGTGSASRSAPR